MATRFAGSRSLDERRRRRLAIEFDGDAIADAHATERETAESSLASAESSNFTPTRLPLKRLVSPAIWKHVLIGFCGLLLGGLFVAGGLYVDEVERVCGPAVAHLVDFETGDLVSIFCAVSLFLAGQLSLLIWWVRSRSRQDFSGRYRIWAWAALFGFIASFTLATDLHHVWSATLLWTWEFGFWKQETLLWLAPAVGSASALIWEIKREFRDCRGSIILFSVAILGWSTAVGLLLFGEALESAEVLRVAATAGAEMLGYFALMLALLVHARHVIYITAEPPAERPSLFSKVARNCIPAFRIRLRLPRRRKRVAAEAAVEPPTASTSAATDNVSAPPEPATKRKPTAKRKRSAKRKSAADEPVADSSAESNRQEPKPDPDEQRPTEPPPAEPKASEPPAAEPAEANDESNQQAPANTTRKSTHRIDDPLDPSQLKGLSKKERRKLRKEHRERQRAAQRG